MLTNFLCPSQKNSDYAPSVKICSINEYAICLCNKITTCAKPCILHILTQTYLGTFVLSFIHSRVDFGNFTLVRLPAYLQRKLQSVLNAAARLVFPLRRYDHITDALAVLHSLRVCHNGSVESTPWGTGARAPSHFYKWLGTGGTVSRRTANKKLNKLY